MSNHRPARCIVCKCKGELIEGEYGYIVTCANKGCPGAPALAHEEECYSKAAAWDYWNYKNGATHATRN